MPCSRGLRWSCLASSLGSVCGRVVDGPGSVNLAVVSDPIVPAETKLLAASTHARPRVGKTRAAARARGYAHGGAAGGGL